MARGRRSSPDSPSSRSSRSKSRGPSRSQSRAPSRSKSRAPSTSRSKSRGPPPLTRHASTSTSAPTPSDKSNTPDLKNSLLFLGTIAAAAFTAHKVWPKGVLYGHKEDWETEHEKHEHGSRKGGHSSRGRDRERERDNRSPPRRREVEGPVYQATAANTRREAPRARTPPPPAVQVQSQQQQRKYLPYEPGVYTPSSVTSSSAFEQRRRERPVMLPLERPRGGSYLPAAVVGRRGNALFEDEGYASRESVPSVVVGRGVAGSRYGEGEREEYRR